MPLSSHRSSMCMTKEIGPRSDPCGMPPFKEHGKPGTRATVVQKGFEPFSQLLGNWFLLYFFKKTLWSTKSNILRKNTKTVLTGWPASRETVHERNAETDARKVDRPARHQDCWWSSCRVTSCKTHFQTNDSRILAAVSNNQIGLKSLLRSVGVEIFGVGTTSADLQTTGIKPCWTEAL